MAIFYSDTFASNQMSTTYDDQFKTNENKPRQGSLWRIASGHWTNGSDSGGQTAANVAMFTLKDTDRLWDLFAYGAGEETGITLNIGVHQWSSETGIGPLAIWSAFASAVDIGSTATNAISIFDESDFGSIGRQRGQLLSDLTGVACEGNEWAVTMTASGLSNVPNHNFGALGYYTSE